MNKSGNEPAISSTLLWFLEGNQNLPIKIKNLIENENGINYISATSIWELAMRVQNKEIEIHFPLRVLETILFQNHILILQPGINEYETISQLPGNPDYLFNRMLIAMAINKNLLLISTENNIAYAGLTIEYWKPHSFFISPK